MASVYTLTLSSGSKAVTSVDALYVKTLGDEVISQYYHDVFSDCNPPTWSNRIIKITPPTWSDGSKVLEGYYDTDGDKRIRADGTILEVASWGTGIPLTGKRVTSDGTWTARWTNVFPTATISKNSGTGGTDEIYFNATDGKWYLDYPFTTELSSAHPLTIPTRAQYQFLGCYSANNTTSTKYINADGTPTADFLALTPSDDITIYARWQQVSYKVTVPHSGGTPTSTVFYAKVGDAQAFYSDDQCTTYTGSITPPKKELYVWDGSFSSSTHTSANTYIDGTGSFCQKLYELLPLTANKSLGSYSNSWTATNAAKITLSGSGWTFAQAAYYTDKTNGGVYAEWVLMDAPLSSLPIPSRDGYRFLGFYSTNATTGTNYVTYEGVIQDALKNRKATTTAYCVGRAKSRTVTLNDGGGSGGLAKFYLDATYQCAFNTASATITSVPIPTKPGYVFKGYWNGSDCIVNENGAITYLALTTDKTFTAQWEHVSSVITVDRGSGTGGTSVFYYNGADGLFYSDSSYTSVITSVTLPTKELHRTDGLYNGATQVVDASGTISASFIPSVTAVTVNAQYTRTCYKLTLNNDGGTSSLSAIYRKVNTSSWYSSEALATLISSVPIPTKYGSTFAGYYNGETQIISANGAILSAAAQNDDFSATASWVAKYYTVTFNANGGTATQDSRQVQEGQPVGELPTATKTGYSSLGWFTQQEGGSPVDATTVITADATFSVHWQAVQYAITYTLNGGTNAPTNPATYTVEDYVTLADPTRDNYAFDGWLPRNYIPSGSTGAKAFTATWKSVVYKTKPTAVSGVTYNGSAQTGVTFDGALTYTGTVSATNAGSYSATFSLPTDTSEAAYRWADGTTDDVTVSWSIATRSVSDSSVTFAAIPNQGYTGSAIRPDVTMYYGGATRTLGTDYTVAYSNNVNVGTATATVSGIGNFTGTKALTFQIVAPEPGKVYIAKPTAAVGVTYTGSAQSGVSYDSRLTASGTVSATNAGTYTATFSLPSNTSSTTYKWEDSSTASVSVSWTIAPRSVADASVTFGAIPDQAYTGTYVTPSVSMSYAGVERIQGGDYALSYSNNVNVGTATATVSGIGNFTGTKALSFSIVRGTVRISKPTAKTGLVFNGQSQTGVNYDARLTVSGTAASVSAGDHSATFSLPQQTATSIYEWSDGTTAAVVVQWSMLPLAITNSSVVFDSIPAHTYTGSPITPPVNARLGSYTITLGVDFNTSYANNVNVGTATVTVSGVSNFTGTKSLSFQIVSPADRVVTFDGCGGTPSEASRTVTDGSQVGQLPTATRTGYDFVGWYTDETGGEEVLPTRTINANVTFYAHWQIVSYSITYVLNGGTNAPNNPASYTVEDAVTLSAPARDGYFFTGWTPDGGVIAVGSTGPKTFSAGWTSSTVYTVTFDANGGSSSDASRTVVENEQIGTLPTATRLGHTFNGWYTAKTGGVQISASYVVTADVVVYARWTANSYTITFNGNGATPSFASKTVTFGQAVGNLPTVYRYGHTFGYWSLGGNQITSATVWGYAENKTATALWDISFGNVIDYFSLGSAKLIPESSDSGDNRQRVAVRHYGKTESGVNATSGVWRNPTVTYAVVGSGNISVTLGKAFTGSATVSGYMVTTAVIATKLGEFPKLTVTATANEGVDAINKFPVTVSVLARARAQNLMSAVSGGGELQELTLSASCDPVVVAENMMPCASDVVNGRITVSATTGAFSNQAEPTAGNGFAQIGAPASCVGTAYKSWRVNLIKEI